MAHPDRLPTGVVSRAAGIALAGLMLAGGASAQVYKCTDSGGRTTYQQSPCSGGQQGKALQLEPENAARSPEAQAAWSAAAAQRRVVNGMPRQWVIQALGSPSEKRNARPGEIASEVWVYVEGSQATRVGFVGDAVAWTMRDPLVAAGASPATAAPARGSEVRAKVAAGRACDEVLNEVGLPSRQEPIGEGDGTAAQARELAGMRYVYEPGPGDDGIRLSFTCIQNRVIDVARAMSR